MIWQDSIFLHLSILVKYKLFIFFSSQMNKLIESSSSHLGAEYLVFVPSRSLKTRETYISFNQLVLLSLHIFEESVFTF